MAIVSQRRDLRVEPRKYGAVVTVDDGEDLVFRDGEGTKVQEGDVSFQGKAGVARKRRGGQLEIALIHGVHVAIGGLSITTADSDLGISASFQKPDEVSGVYNAPRASQVVIEPATGVFFVDGQPASEAALPAGTHHWQITKGDPVPMAPRILRTENFAGGARVRVEPVGGATSYSYEMSRDGGATWTAVSSTVSGLPDGVKVHIRVIAKNASKSSGPGPEYPLYVSSKPPLPPDGLSIALRDGGAALSWGEVLGASEYRLYAGSRLVYAGLERRYLDLHAGGPYSVAAVNGNGEGPHSIAVQGDVASWLTFDPKPGEPFRRAPVEETYYPR
jgi:hypothetical protein